jgi:hypothetical protein
MLLFLWRGPRIPSVIIYNVVLYGFHRLKGLQMSDLILDPTLKLDRAKTNKYT